MPDVRHHDAHIEGKLICAALLEELPFEEHAGLSEKLSQSTSACPNLCPEKLVVSQPIYYQGPFLQRRQFVGQLPLLGPTVFDNRRTD